MKKIFFGFVLLLIIVPLVYLWVFHDMKIFWHSDDVIKYESCEKFGKEYPCNKGGGFDIPIGVAGCSYFGLWIKDLDIKIFKIKMQCML